MTIHDDGLELTSAHLDFGRMPDDDEQGELPSEVLAERHDDTVAAALGAQLDRVLEILWSFEQDGTTFTRHSRTMAQLAMHICCLYPQSTMPMQHVALTTSMLELYPREVRLARERVSMTRRESELLHYLLRHRERVIPRDELMERVWGKRLNGAAARTVDIHIHRLRTKLGNEFAERLETIRGLGYRFSVDPIIQRKSRPKPPATT
jgi:DNA-binding response OmpR family regulator